MNHNAQRSIQFARHGGEIAHQLVGFFADQAAGGEVGQNARHQLTRLEQGQRCTTLGFFHARQRFGLQGMGNRFVLQLFQRQEHAAEVGAQHPFLDAGFRRGLQEVVLALLGGVEVQRVNVERFTLRHHQVDAQHVHGEVLLQAAHAPAACIFTLAQGQRDFVAADFDRDCARGGRYAAGGEWFLIF